MHCAFNRVFIFLPLLARKARILDGERLMGREGERFAVVYVWQNPQIFFSVLYSLYFLLSATEKLQQIDSFTAPQS